MASTPFTTSEHTSAPLRTAESRRRKVPFFAALIAGVHSVRHHDASIAIAGLRQAVLLLCSLRKHASVLRVLSHPQSAHLTSQYPLLPFIYLGNYVAVGLPLAARRAIFLTHFQFVQRKFNNSFLASMANSPIAVWHRTIGHRTFDVALGLNYPQHREGDLMLSFRMDGAMVYRLTFSFASGRHFDLPDATVIVVAAIQGVPDFERVKLATRTCSDIQPAHILMAALGALADLVGVSTILGLHQARQLLGEQLYFAYDRFFEIYGPEIADQRLYLIKVPYSEKPLSEIERSHRKRTQRKRAFKGDTRHQVVESLSLYLADRPPAIPGPHRRPH
jgi:uncharacterized protein